jgi:hypothetical protein
MNDELDKVIAAQEPTPNSALSTQHSAVAPTILTGAADGPRPRGARPAGLQSRQARQHFAQPDIATQAITRGAEGEATDE